MTRIEPLDSGNEEQWERFVETHPRAGIYHSLAWRDVIVDGFGHDPQYLCARDNSGDVTGVLPLFRVRGWRGHRLVSTPMRDRTGPVGNDPAIERELLLGAIALARESGADYLDVRTLDPLDAGAVEGLPLELRQHWVTSRVDVTAGPKAAFSRLHQKVRQHVRKAEAQGVRVELDSSEAGVKEFFDLFVRARTAMGIPPFPSAFVHAVWRHLIARGKANLFVARAESGPTNAMINLLSKDTVIAAYSAPQKDALKFYPAETVYWRTIEFAAQNGYGIFDFGADSPEQEGLIAFKSKFGATQTTMSTYYFLNRAAAPPNFDSSSGRYALARRVWSWFPHRLSRALGAVVTRRLS